MKLLRNIVIYSYTGCVPLVLFWSGNYSGRLLMSFEPVDERWCGFIVTVIKSPLISTLLCDLQQKTTLQWISTNDVYRLNL